MFQDELRRMSDEKKHANQNRVSYEFGIDSDNIDDSLIDKLLFLCKERAENGKDDLIGSLCLDGDGYGYYVDEEDRCTDFVYDAGYDQRLKDYATRTYVPYGNEKKLFAVNGWGAINRTCISDNKEVVNLLAKEIYKRLVKRGLSKADVNVKSVNAIYRRVRENGLIRKKYTSEDTIIATGYRIYIDIKW